MLFNSWLLSSASETELVEGSEKTAISRSTENRLQKPDPNPSSFPLLASVSNTLSFLLESHDKDRFLEGQHAPRGAKLETK